MRPSILVVDDEPAVRFGFSQYLSKVGYRVSGAGTLAEGAKALAERGFDAVLLDLRLPDGHGLDWIADLRKAHPGMGIVVVTAAGDIPSAVEAIRRGADQFLTKPVSMPDLDVFLRKTLELEALRRGELARQRLSVADEPYFGQSPAAKAVMELAHVAAENDAPVLFQGETGTGKGVLARWIHDHSKRGRQLFVELNCSCLRGELLVSELFGHARGAFTSAVQDRQGLIEVADRGTLFLDEISDMDLGVQAQFLKVIEEKRYRRLGEVELRQSEFRVICATSRDLQEAVRQKVFRQDIYYRINVFPIRLPPLREVLDDLDGLVRHILTTLGAADPELTPAVMRRLQAYKWPGNVRELRNVLERAMLLARGRPLTPDHFPGLDVWDTAPADAEDTLDLEKLALQHIQRALDRFGGNVEKAADALGVSERTLYRRLKKLRRDQ